MPIPKMASRARRRHHPPAATGSEIWKPIAGHAAYEVSNHGRVRRVEMVVRKTLTPATILRSRLDKNSRLVVSFRVGGRQMRQRVNVLVFRAFVGDLPRKFQIDHVDGNFSNCRPENLRLADRYIPAEDDMRWCGKNFGYWLVLRRAGKDKYGNAMWLCRCVCGTERRVHVGDLRRGMSRNCGCMNGELQNLSGDRNPAWRGGRSRDQQTPGTYGWCSGKLNAINFIARQMGHAPLTATAEEIATAYERSQGVCAVCRNTPRGKRSLVLDHDHVTGKMRDFLCNHCNVSIGMAGDSAAMLRRLADYIEAHESAGRDADAGRPKRPRKRPRA
jgi:hypothetical protein